MSSLAQTPQRWFAVLAFATALIWGGRVRNIAADDTAGWSQVLPAVGFLAVAAVAAAIAWRMRRHGAARPGDRVLGAGVATLTTVWWVFRGIDIAFDDHALGFVAIHSLLELGE